MSPDMASPANEEYNERETESTSARSKLLYEGGGGTVLVPTAQTNPTLSGSRQYQLNLIQV